MRCAQCGSDHPLDELELFFRRPDEVALLSDEERSQRVQENPDLCVLDGTRFFVRGVIPLPVAQRERPYNIGAWVEVSPSSFERIYELWSEPDQDREPPLEGVLANAVTAGYSAFGLQVRLSLTGATTRPAITVLAADHTLFSEQTQGISAHRAHEYSSRSNSSTA